MKVRTKVIFGSVAGAMAVHLALIACGTGGTGNPDPGRDGGASDTGMIGTWMDAAQDVLHDVAGMETRDANAQSQPCCVESGPTFTKLAEFDMPAGSGTTLARSPIVAVGGYREVVVYAGQGSCSVTTLWFRPDAATPFGYTGQLVTVGRARVDGVDMQLASQCGTSVHYVVAGVR